MFPGPFEILSPNERWAPTQSQIDALQNAYEKLLPPLVYKIRAAVAEWREKEYEGVSNTSRYLLNFWFNQEHLVGQSKFSFFFSQREAIESVIYLYEAVKARDKYELMKFDASGRVSTGMFDETWTRYVVKMATGAGKTKVMALALVWSYFHKLYEPDSPLSKNILVIAPNIIVLNRLRKDFDGLKMFFEEPFIPENGVGDKDWKNDFQPTLHIQDDLKPFTESGNIFLTNIHRVFFNEDPTPSIETTFLGIKPRPDADTSKGLDLGKVLRSDKIKDLVALNDEAHHIHDKSLAWFKSIEDISNKLKLKNGNGLSLQADFSATPKHNNGGIFVQTICDYPLVEAIRQNVVKSPVLPDQESRQKIQENDSSDFIERYGDFIHLGYTEWENQYQAVKNEKTPILFIMTVNTADADQAAAFLETQYPLMKNAVLSIHTNKSGEISADKKNPSKKDIEALEKLRKAADDIDKDFSPYRAVVSVLMLREGWDVRNVSTIVGLRPYNNESDILPEQTIGRGLRKMFPLDRPEKLVIVGTKRFLDFVESLKTEGVEFQYSPMSVSGRTKKDLVIEVDTENPGKNLEALDIPIPELAPRIFREYKNLAAIDVSRFVHARVPIIKYRPDEIKEIVFKDIDDQHSHTTLLQDSVPDYRNVLAFFTQGILRDNKLFSGFDILYPKVEDFVRNYLFEGEPLDLTDKVILKNLAAAQPKHILFEVFRTAINELTIVDSGETRIRGYRSLTSVKPKIVPNQAFFQAQKCIFTLVVADNSFELDVAALLDRLPDVVAFAKNNKGKDNINFHVEYQKENGSIAEYYPDFLVKTSDTDFFVLETKGREDLDDVRKIKRLTAWCTDINAAQNSYRYTALYIRQEDWDKKRQDLRSFSEIKNIFKVERG